MQPCVLTNRVSHCDPPSTSDPCRVDNLVAMSETAKAVRVRVRGAVQGVGFRDATVGRARGRGSSAGSATPRTAPCSSTPRGPRRRWTSWSSSSRGAACRAGRGRRGRGDEGRGPRAVRRPRGQRRGLRRPGALGDRAPLRPPARGRRGDALLGGAERPLDGPGGEAAGDRGRRPLDRPQRLRGRDRRRQGEIWDRGSYEQGGRVPWPEALERGHAVFVLHGEKLEGGFALQRTRGGEKPQWLLIKRKDEFARPGST